MFLAYRKLESYLKPNFLGVPGVRDKRSECDMYQPRPVKSHELPGCNGDGHYLCEKCCHLNQEEE